MLIAVIGSGFGDEGKGVITNYVCSIQPQEQLIVNVRFNGGAQAAHTVTIRGKRHVFHHFGSGSFNPNVVTYLAEDFICNPIVFCQELDELIQKGVFPKIFINQNCIVTTPFEMMVNQIIEEYRQHNKHGSCGLGIFETFNRNKVERFDIKSLRMIGNKNYNDFTKDKILQDYLKKLRKWAITRLTELGVKEIKQEWLDRINSDEILFSYLKKLTRFLNYAKIVDNEEVFFSEYEVVVFEGAQGLLLDQNNTKYFPYLTPSNTGTTNIRTIIKNAKLTEPLELIYVTRAYATRHGAGPFSTEIKGLSYEDKTNKPNDWQGTLRFGLLDIDEITEAIINDATKNTPALAATITVAVTCIDQVPQNNHLYKVNGAVKAGSIGNFLEDIERKIGSVKYKSYDPMGPKN